MFNHISIGVRDIARSKAFYDSALEAIGYRRLSEGEDSLGYGKEEVGLLDQPRRLSRAGRSEVRTAFLL